MFEKFRKLGTVRYLMLIAIVGYGLYGWASLNGYRILGDDADSREKHGFAQGGHRSHRSHRSHFYHK